MDARSLDERLADALPENVKARVYHISTPPIASPAIFSAAPGQDDQPTQCETHFLGLSSPEEGNEGEVFVFAIEILIFTTDTLTSVFVSKADSSGFISRLHLRSGVPSVPQTITRTFLDYLLAPRLQDRRLVLSLFARSQNQYLFPGSIDNPEKHVLDDRQLIRWWCRVLDSVCRPYDGQRSLAPRKSSYRISSHVVVPGCDKAETRAFFPPPHERDARESAKWIDGYPMQQLSLDTSLPLRCLIPRLPDDPKSRFLDDLDGNYIGPNGEWRSVKTMEQFWEMMSYRQECSAGRLVGFVWVVFSESERDEEPGNPDHPPFASFSSDVSTSGPLLTPGNSQRPFAEVADLVGPTSEDLRPILQPASPPPSSPMLGPLYGDAAQSNDKVQINHSPNGHISHPGRNINGADNIESRPVGTPVVPSKTPGQVVIPATDYEILIEELLEMDFAGSEMAATSTQIWLARIAEKADVPSFGSCLVGSKVSEISQAGAPKASPQVNMLTGVRKKRKADTGDRLAGAKPDAESALVLPASLVRKKPKVNGNT